MHCTVLALPLKDLALALIPSLLKAPPERWLPFIFFFANALTPDLTSSLDGSGVRLTSLAGASPQESGLMFSLLFSPR